MKIRIFFIISALVLLICTYPALATTYYVNPGDLIQDAIDAAGNGDEIELEPGTYDESIDFKGKAITLRSTDPNDPNVVATTIISKGTAPVVVVCINGEQADTVLSGLTITNGSYTWGGGMYNSDSSPTVTHCIFSENQAVDNGVLPGGGGMYNYNSSPTVTHCTFSDNHAQGTADGGGMYNTNNSHPIVTDCTFINNSGWSGGGMCNDGGSTPTLADCTFSGNAATFGGGMSNDGTSPIVTNCSFIGNSAQNYGGGMRNTSGSPTVTGCTFNGNTADLQGGGICNESSASPIVSNCSFTDNVSHYTGGGMHNEDYSSPSVTNCLFLANSVTVDSGGFGGEGGGMYNENYSAPSVINCTFTANNAQTSGGGMRNYSNANTTVKNGIFWGDIGGEISSTDSSPVVTYCDVQGGYSGTGNINADPKFIDAASRDLRLDEFSVCADAGNNAAVPAGVFTDLDGNPRFVDEFRAPDSGAGTAPIVDMGACERQQEPNPESIVIEVPMDFTSIQTAINWCLDGDEVVVAPGTYYETINFLGKAITLRSTDPDDPNVVSATIIDANGASHVVVCNQGEGPDTILSGFTITDGWAGGDSTYGWSGGGMYNSGSSPTVTRCTFIKNTARYVPIVGDDHGLGGGMCNDNNSCPTVTNCTFLYNRAAWGGGMYNYNSNPVVKYCLFEGNYTWGVLGPTNRDGGPGGGMANENSSPTVIDCIFNGNWTQTGVSPSYGSGGYGGAGGGMWNGNGNSSPHVINCAFWSNYTGNGGYAYGILEDGGNGGDGAGMYNGSGCVPFIINCCFYLNHTGVGGSGDSGGDGGRLGLGGGIYQSSDSPVVNSILWDNFSGSPSDQIYNQIYGSATVTYSDVQGGGYIGSGNIDADPLFVGGHAGRQLSPDSPCIDAGENDSVPADTTDIDGDGDTVEPIPLDLDGRPRFVDGDCNGTAVVDMGTFEFNYTSMGDFDYNCTVNFNDFAIFAKAWLTEPPKPVWYNRFKHLGIGIPLCDISIPPDDYIDLSDLSVLVENWMTDL